MDAHPNEGWLLGDSGYPLKNWLITPLATPANPQELRFQKAHCKTRNTVERAFGVLKQRFRYLINCIFKIQVLLKCSMTRLQHVVM